MNQYERAVQEIRDILKATGDPELLQLKRVAQEYQDLVLQLNHQLQQCDELLCNGNRGQALQRLEGNPHLLDVVSVLDFPEQTVWGDYIAQFQIDTPPRLQIDIAADLNRAYRDEAPLKEVLQRYRWSSLSRAPLPERLKWLRQIATLDKDNHRWQEDLKEFEKARLEEIKEEVKTAAKERQIQTVATIERELLTPGWTTKPGRNLVEWVKKAHDLLRGEQSRKEMSRLAEDLSAAYSADDLPEGLRLYQRWKALELITALPADDPLHQEVAPALEWFSSKEREEQQGQQYQQAVGALSGAVWSNDAALTQYELEIFRYNVECLGPVPEELVEPYDNRLAGIKRRERNKSLKKTGAIAAVVLLALGTGGYFYRGNLQASYAERHAAHLAGLLEQEDIAGARDYFDNTLKPDGWLEFPNIADLEPKLEAAETGFQEREARLAAGLKTSQALLERLTARAGENADLVAAIEQNPEQAVTRDYSVTFAERFQMLSQLKAQQPGILENFRTSEREALADPVTVNEEELSEAGRDYLKLLKQTDEQEQQLTDRNRKLFEAIDQAIQAHIAGLKREDQNRSKELTTRLGELNRWPEISANLRGHLPGLITKLETDSRNYQMALEEENYLGKIASSVENVVAFARQLENYRPAQSNSQRSEDFKHILEHEREIWESVAKWNQVSSDWNRQIKRYGQLSPADAFALTTVFEQHSAQLKRFPDFARLQAAREAFQKVSSRKPQGGQRLCQELRVLLVDNPELASETLLMALTATGDHYYLVEPLAAPLGRKYKVKYQTDLSDADSVKKEDIPETEMKLRKRDGQVTWLSPQSLFVLEIDRKLTALDNGNENPWEQTFAELIEDARNFPDMDPIVKRKLIEIFADFGSRGSQIFTESFQEPLKKLGEVKVPGLAAFMDPLDETSRRIRPGVRDGLAKLPALDVVKADLKKRTQEFQQQDMGATYEWVGWMYRDSKNAWVCALSPRYQTAGRTGDLVTLHSEADSPDIRVTRVGRLQKNRPELEPPQGARLREGRPVYLLVNAR